MQRTLSQQPQIGQGDRGVDRDRQHACAEQSGSDQEQWSSPELVLSKKPATMLMTTIPSTKQRQHQKRERLIDRRFTSRGDRSRVCNPDQLGEYHKVAKEEDQA